MPDKRFDATPKSKEKSRVKSHERKTKRGQTAVKAHWRQLKPGEKFTAEQSAAIQKDVGADRFSAEEFHKGMNEELEHYDITEGDPFETADIVLAHLKERDDYYERLEEAMEDD